jgi:hypothetical protein
MQHADAGIYHERAWRCLQEANLESDKGRRAIFTTAAFAWRTIARDIEDAAVREIQHATQLVDDAHEGWLRAELAIAQVSQLATTLDAAPGPAAWTIAEEPDKHHIDAGIQSLRIDEIQGKRVNPQTG